MRLAPLAVALLLAGCIGGDPEDPVLPGSNEPSGPPEPIGPPLRFGGVLRDALTGEPIPDASLRIDLSQVQPCARQGIGWTSWQAPSANGTFGPLEVARPRSDDVAFFLHATAPGYGENVTMIGPAEAAGDLGNLSIVLHAEHAIHGRAPPGTILALDAPRYPRFAVADANGTFSFPAARVVNATLVADTPLPFRATVAAPAEVEVADEGARGWRLEGTVKGPSGAPLATDITAWNGSELVSAARSGDNGAFVLPLPPEPMRVRIEARTPEMHLGATLALELQGPPAQRASLLARALC